MNTQLSHLKNVSENNIERFSEFVEEIKTRIENIFPGCKIHHNHPIPKNNCDINYLAQNATDLISMIHSNTKLIL